MTYGFVAKNTEILDDYTLRIRRDSESFLCGQGDSKGFTGTKKKKVKLIYLIYLCRTFKTNYMSIILWHTILEDKKDRDAYKAEKKRKIKLTRCWWLPLDTTKSGPHTKTEVFPTRWELLWAFGSWGCGSSVLKYIVLY